MQFLIEQIGATLAGSLLLGGVVGWLIHNVFSQGRMRAIEASKNLEIEQMRGDLQSAQLARTEASNGLTAAIQKVKDSEAKLVLAGQSLTSASKSHENEANQLKNRISALEPLRSDVADREAQIANWHRRFDGIVREKDLAVAALNGHVQAAPPDSDEHKSKLAAMSATLASMGATLAAMTAQKDSLESQLNDHKQKVAEKDGFIAELRAKVDQAESQAAEVTKRHATLVDEHDAKLAEVRALIGQRDEQLKSFDSRMRGSAAEKDTVIGKLRSMVSQLEPLKQELAQRDKAIDEMQKQMQSSQARLRTSLATLTTAHEEAKRENNTLLAGTQSLKTALDGKDSEIAALTSKLAELEPIRARFAETEAAHAGAQAQLADHEHTLAGLRAQVESLGGAHSTDGAQVSELRGKIAELESLHTATLTKLQEKEQALSALDLQYKDAVMTQQNLSQAQMDEKDAQIAALTNQTADLAGRHAAAQGQVAEGAAALAAFEAKFRDHASTHEAVGRDLDARSQEVENKHREVADLDQKLMASLTAGQEKDALIAALTNQTADLAGRHAAAQGNVADGEAALAAFEAKFRDHAATHGAVARDLDARSQEVESKHREVADLDQKLMASLTAGQEKDALIVALTNQTADLAGRHAAAQADLAERDAALAALEAKLRDRAATHEAVGRDLEARNQEVDGKHREVADLDQKLMASLTAVQEKDKLIAALTNQAADLAGRHAAAQGDLADRDATLAALGAKLRDHLSTHEAVSSDLDARGQEVDRVKAEVADLDRKLMAALKTGEEKDAKLTTFENQVVDVSGRHAGAQSDLEDWSQRYAALDARLKELTDTHEAALRSLADKQEELDKTRAIVAKLDTQYMAAVSAAPPTPEDLVQARARIAQLEKALDAEVPREATLRTTIAARESEMAELRSYITDRDERLEAWDSRFHASVGEFHGEVGTLNSKVRELESDLRTRDEQLSKLKTELAAAPLAMSATAGLGGDGSVSTTDHHEKPKPASHSEAVHQLKTLLESEASLRGIQFLPHSAELIPPSLPILARAADLLHEHPDVRIEVSGHTDNWGDPQTNLRLSHARAGAVKEYLINCGIAAWRLVDVGYGETQPLDSNETPDGRFVNRRIELHVRQ